MTLYFTQMRISRTPSARALATLISPADQAARIDAHHKLIWAAFTDGADRNRDFLWREEADGSFLTLSERAPVQMDLFDPFVIKPFAPFLRAGEVVSFALRANATRTKRGVGRVDVVMDALHNIPKDERATARPQIAQAEATTWLDLQGAKAGFNLQSLSSADYTTLTLPDYRGPRRGQPQFGILDITGTLTVTDPVAFVAQLSRGFGRAKAFGCGLMLIRRAR
ncbi:MAG: type I-E CRISPR-associated protein Cas6/Cse3/CasE [Loktanella sp.]|nr:type I-E CRISPR-associated protein Cas6/Cse3/CasE [Loktanella sp.]